MATFSLGNVPSPVNQALRLAQLREAQNPNLALERQLQQAIQLQQLQQQSPEGQLALQLRQAQLNSAIQNQAFQQQQQGLQLEAMRRAVPTDLERAIQQAGVQSQARQLGVFQAPQIAGQPASLPALPVSAAAQSALAATPDNAPFFEETVSALEAPVQIGPGEVFDPVTARATQQQSAELKRADAERKLRSDEAIKQEFELERIKAKADAAGFKTYVDPTDPTNILNLTRTEQPPAGYMEVANYLKSIKPATTATGKGTKLSEGENQFLASAFTQSNSLNEIVQTYDDLASKGKAGFIGGKKQAVRSFVGAGDEEFSQANARVKGNLFGLARSLQGAGVLTEKDIERMEALVPSLGVVRGQFVGSLKGVGQLMVDKIRGFKEARGSALDPASLQRVEQMQERLEGFIRGQQGAQPSPASTPAPSKISPASNQNFTSEADARAAGFKTNDVIFLNGVPGRLK